MNAYLGEIAALTTAVLFSFSSSIFTMVGRKIGSVMLNRLRLVLAVAWLLLAHAVLNVPLPLHEGVDRWLWLGLSGIVGLVLGDALLFQAFISIGARLTMLLMALAPAFAALAAWLLLGEILSWVQIAGILLTLAGVGWVVQERLSPSPIVPVDRKQYLRGLLYGLEAAIGQAGGLVLAKPGAAGDFPALSATFLRMVSAMITLWLLTLLRGQVTETIKKIAFQPSVLSMTLLLPSSDPSWVSPSLSMPSNTLPSALPARSRLSHRSFYYQSVTSSFERNSAGNLWLEHCWLWSVLHCSSNKEQMK